MSSRTEAGEQQQQVVEPERAGIAHALVECAATAAQSAAAAAADAAEQLPPHAIALRRHHSCIPSPTAFEHAKGTPHNHTYHYGYVLVIIFSY